MHVLPAGRLGGGPIGWLKALRRGRRRAGRGEAALSRASSRRGGRLRRLSGVPALLAAARRASRPCARAECGARPGQPAARRRGRRDRAPPIDEVERLKPQYAGRSRSSAIRCARRSRGWRTAVPAVRRSRAVRMLVTGGSQGATVLSRSCPRPRHAPAVAAPRLQVIQQCRPEDIDAVRARYAELGIPAELMTYFEDMPDKLADAHLVIARAGASTIAELTAAGRPAILVPLPIATDDHQTANAREMAKAGGARRSAGSSRPTSWPARSRRWPGPAGARPMPRRAPLSVGRPNAARPCRPRRAHRRRTRAGRRSGPRSPPRVPRSDRWRRQWRRCMKALGTDIGTIHFVGIGGIGMSGIAEVMHNSATRCRARTSPKAMSSRGCASAASRSRSATARTISAMPRWS